MQFLRRSVILSSLLLLGLAGFVALALGYDHEPLASLDEAAAEWVAADLPSSLETLARPFSWLGGWIGLTAFGVAVVFVVVREHAWLDVAFFVAAVLG